MSLINQMLQDLDARRIDAGAAGPYGQQVRAVPPRRGMHPAWWLAIALAGVLVGVLGWLWLRPPVDAVSQTQTQAQLPLKLDTDLKLAQASAAEQAEYAGAIAAPPVAAPAAPIETDKPVPRAAESLPSVKAKEPEEPKNAPTTVTEKRPVNARQKTESVSAAGASAATAKVGAASEPIAPVLPARAPSAAGTARAEDKPPSSPVAIHKQFAETTPQQRAENEYRKALLLIQQGRAPEAGSMLEQSIQLDPRHVGARQALIGVLLDGRRPDEAMRVARAGLDLDVQQTGLAMILARLQLEKGGLTTAIDTLERTLPYAAENADYQAFLAALLQRAERHKRAIEHYGQALQKAPQNGVWWMGLGISLQADGRAADALEAFKRARAGDGLSPELLAFVDGRIGQLQR
jgi:MSHA biogenesis protein MshN